MIAIERVGVVLLAAGLSRRFGSADKLAATLGGLPLGLHAAQTLGAMPFAAKIAVVGAAPLDFGAHGFTVVANPAPAEGQAGSIGLGVGAIRLRSVDAIMIALADMPFVPAAHILSLLALFEGPASIAGSSGGELRSPPALFGSCHFDALQALEGDRGANTLLREAKFVTTSPADLVDIDTQADLVDPEISVRR